MSSTACQSSYTPKATFPPSDSIQWQMNQFVSYRSQLVFNGTFSTNRLYRATAVYMKYIT